MEQQENNIESRRSRDTSMGKIIELGKLCIAILAIGAVMAVLGGTQWASKKDVQELKAKHATTESDIRWMKAILERIERKL